MSESKDQEASGVNQAVPQETGTALILTGLRQAMAGDVSGMVGRITLVLVALTVTMQVLREVGVQDKAYPFFTQAQGQSLQRLVEDDHGMICDLVRRTGGDVPPSCSATITE